MKKGEGYEQADSINEMIDDLLRDAPPDSLSYVEWLKFGRTLATQAHAIIGLAREAGGLPDGASEGKFRVPEFLGSEK